MIRNGFRILISLGQIAPGVGFKTVCYRCCSNYSLHRIELTLKIQASDIKPGDLIGAYYNNKMQVCTVKSILEPYLNNVTFSVYSSESSRNSIFRTVRFQQSALIERYDKQLAPSPMEPNDVENQDIEMVEEGLELA
jgi:hypothetical protein